CKRQVLRVGNDKTRIRNIKTLIASRNRNGLHRLRQNWQWDHGRELCEIKICVCTVSRVGRVINTARNVLLLEEIVERFSNLIGNLVPTAHSSLAGSEPWHLPSKPDSGPKIVPVVWIPRGTGVRRILSNKLEFSDFASNARFHPIGEAFSGDSEDRI